jgi:translation elongation factor EF-G
MVLSLNQKLTGGLANNYNGTSYWFVNKMDRQGADFINVCAQVKEMFGSHAIAPSVEYR